LDKLEGNENRRASFSCVLCFYLSHDEVYFFEGRVEGQISQEMRGDEGFGYDPVFIPERHEGDNTFAMIPDWKEKNGHRARASQHAIKFFDKKR
jgi:XTP/dITP diphosphohydrolase